MLKIIAIVVVILLGCLLARQVWRPFPATRIATPRRRVPVAARK
jgi:hypothetical protein